MVFERGKNYPEIDTTNVFDTTPFEKITEERCYYVHRQDPHTSYLYEIICNSVPHNSFLGQYFDTHNVIFPDEIYAFLSDLATSIPKVGFFNLFNEMYRIELDLLELRED